MAATLASFLTRSRVTNAIPSALSWPRPDGHADAAPGVLSPQDDEPPQVAVPPVTRRGDLAAGADHMKDDLRGKVFPL